MSSHGEPERKRLLLKEFIERDMKAADFRISLFLAAAKSYKYDSCLQPFPPMYSVNKEKNIEKLVSYFNSRIAEVHVIPYLHLLISSILRRG